VLLIAAFAGCAIIAFALGIATLAALAPGRFRLERSLVTNAPREAIWAMIADLRAGMRWSPWQSADDNVNRSYTGPSVCMGAREQWSGTGRAGEGLAEITRADPEQIIVRVCVLRPQARQVTLGFQLMMVGASTRITWIVVGAAPYAARLAEMLFGPTRKVEADFDARLVRPKAIAERDSGQAL